MPVSWLDEEISNVVFGDINLTNAISRSALAHLGLASITKITPASGSILAANPVMPSRPVSVLLSNRL